MTRRRGRPHAYASSTCAVDGCNAPRKLLHKVGRPDWHSKYCAAHHAEDLRQRNKMRRQGKPSTDMLVDAPPVTARDNTHPVRVVYEAWCDDRALGIVRLGSRRVYGLKAVADGYAATVTGVPPATSLERVLLTGDALLSVWGKE